MTTLSEKFIRAEELAEIMEISVPYLTAEEQAWLLDGIRSEKVYPTMAQAGKIRRFSASGNLNSDVLLSILMESKPQTTGSYKLPLAKFAHFFKDDSKPEEIEDTIEKALKLYFETGVHKG